MVRILVGLSSVSASKGWCSIASKRFAMNQSQCLTPRQFSNSPPKDSSRRVALGKMDSTRAPRHACLISGRRKRRPGASDSRAWREARLYLGAARLVVLIEDEGIRKFDHAVVFMWPFVGSPRARRACDPAPECARTVSCNRAVHSVMTKRMLVGYAPEPPYQKLPLPEKNASDPCLRFVEPFSVGLFGPLVMSCSTESVPTETQNKPKMCCNRELVW